MNGFGLRADAEPRVCQGDMAELCEWKRACMILLTIHATAAELDGQAVGGGAGWVTPKAFENATYRHQLVKAI